MSSDHTWGFFLNSCKISFFEAPFFFIFPRLFINSNIPPSASPIKTASKKRLKTSGFVAPTPPAIIMGSCGVRFSLRIGIPPSSRISRTPVIPSSYPREKPSISRFFNGMPVSRV